MQKKLFRLCKENRPVKVDDDGYDYPYFDPDDPMAGAVVSATECTGLTATIPENEFDALALRDIYDIPLEPNPIEQDSTAAKKKPEDTL